MNLRENEGGGGLLATDFHRRSALIGLMIPVVLSGCEPWALQAFTTDERAFLSSGPENGPASMPEDIRATLDRRYPGWRLSPVAQDVQRGVHGQLGPTPGWVSGDFNADGNKDFAAMVDYPITQSPGTAYDRLVVTLAFMARADGYLLMRVNDPMPGPADNQYMTLRRRGTVGFDFRRAGHFRYQRDAIGFWFFEKGGGTYHYRNGRFHYLTESD